MRENITMTLQQAYEQWAALPENKTIAEKYRTAIKKVLLKEHCERDVRSLTEFQVRRMIMNSHEEKGMKVKAVSALISILKYAAAQKACVRPDFSISIASMEQETPADPCEERSGTVCQEDAEPPVAVTEKPKKKATKAKRKSGSGRKPVAVVQIDRDTLKPVRTFSSICEAAESLGKSNKNIFSAMKRKGMAYGFYWCRADEASDDFVPGTRRVAVTTNRRSKVMKDAWDKKKECPSPSDRNDRGKVSLSDYSDAELRDELRRLGWYGTLYMRLDFDNMIID